MTITGQQLDGRAAISHDVEHRRAFKHQVPWHLNTSMFQASLEINYSLKITISQVRPDFLIRIKMIPITDQDSISW